MPSSPRASLDDLARLGLGVVDPRAAPAPRLEVLVERLRPAHDRLRDQLGQPVARRRSRSPSTRAASRVAARGNMRPKVMIWATDSRPVLLGARTGSPGRGPSPRSRCRCPASRSRSALRKRSKSRSYSSGSTSVICSAVGDDRARRRAAARAHRDAAVLGELHEVPDDQEVGGEAHLLDHRRAPSRAARPPRPAAGRRSGGAGPRRRARAGTRPRARPSGVSKRGISILPSSISTVAALGDLERGGRRLRPVGERGRHLVGVLEVELVGVEAQLRLGQRALGLHAEQRRCGCRSPRGAGSARRPWPPAGARARGRRARCPRWPCPGPRCRSSGPRSRRRRGRRPGSARRRGARASAGAPSTSRRQKRDCRQPVSAMTPSE